MAATYSQRELTGRREMAVDKPALRLRDTLAALSFAIAGLAGILAFHAGNSFPLPLSIGMAVASGAVVAWQFLARRCGVVPPLLFGFFALPFVHVLPYLWYDFDGLTPKRLWGLATNPYMLDLQVIELTAMMGAVGCTAIATGSALFATRIDFRSSKRPGPRFLPLTMPETGVMLAASIMLSWLAAPAETVLVVAYADAATTTQAQSLNLSAAWMIAYALLIFCIADALIDPAPQRARAKRNAVLLAAGFSVVWFQLLRGDRESLSFIVAAALMFLYWGQAFAPAGRPRGWRPLLGLGAVAALIFVAHFLVGTLRHALTGVESISDAENAVLTVSDAGAFELDWLLTGTWSAVLLTPLSVAGDYMYTGLELKAGQTYIDFLLSIVPGFIADSIGFERPIDATRGPAWDMRYGIGGTHAAVVPFMNFRMAGVYFVVLAWTLWLANLERRVARKPGFAGITLLGIITMAVPHWLWYGEKALITSLLVWGIIMLALRLRHDLMIATRRT